MAFAVFPAIGFAVISCFWVHALKTGRVRAKGKIIEKKKEPVSYWMSMVVYAIAGLALLFYTVVGLWPDLFPNSRAI